MYKTTHRGTSSVVCSGVSGCCRSLSITHTHPGDPAGGEQALTHPSSNPRISPDLPRRGFLCGFASSLDVLHLSHSCDSQTAEDFTEWASCKASASYFYWLIEHPPTPALLHNVLVLCTFLLCFLNPSFPGHWVPAQLITIFFLLSANQALDECHGVKKMTFSSSELF